MRAWSGTRLAHVGEQRREAAAARRPGGTSATRPATTVSRIGIGERRRGRRRAAAASARGTPSSRCEHALEEAADLARADHVHVERREDLRAARERLGERLAALHRVQHLGDRRASARRGRPARPGWRGSGRAAGPRETSADSSWVMTRRSRRLTRLPPKLGSVGSATRARLRRAPPAATSPMLSGMRPRSCRRATTAGTSAASIVPSTTFPCASTARYWNCAKSTPHADVPRPSPASGA